MQISPLFNNYSVENPLNLESVASKKILNDTTSENKTDSTTSVGFKDVLVNVVQAVNESQITSDKKIEGLIRGDQDITMHDVMISLQESQMSMQLLIEVRNKLYDCYQQLNSVNI